jgi:hypothetical protein
MQPRVVSRDALDLEYDEGKLKHKPKITYEQTDLKDKLDK